MACASLACVIEMLCEPWWIFNMITGNVKTRAAAEALAIFVQCFVTLTCVLSSKYQILAFGIGMIAYSTTLLATFVILSERIKLKLSLAPFFENSATVLAFVFQSIEKMLLTEGAKLVLIAYRSSLLDEVSGVYGLVENLGGIVVRIIFRPVEEMCALLFSQSIHGVSGKSTQVFQSVCLYTKLMLSIGLFGVCFGSPVCNIIIAVLYGEKWYFSDAGNTLAAHTLYLVFLAVNGVTEAFTFSTMTASQIQVYNLLLFVFSGIFVSCSMYALRANMGASGLVFSSCLSMSLRIAYSLNFISRTFKRSLWQALKLMFPGWLSLLSLCSSCLVLRLFVSKLCIDCLLALSWPTKLVRILPLVACSLVLLITCFLILLWENADLRLELLRRTHKAKKA